MIELFRQYSQNPSIQLRNKIVQNNLNLVHHVAKRFRHRSDFDDLVQVGYLALIRCVERFDVQLGNQFSSYAVTCIRGAIFHYLRDKSHTVKIPRKYVELLSKAKKMSSLSEVEVASKLGVSIDEWRDAKNSATQVRSLDTLVYDSEDVSLLDTISDRTNPYANILIEEVKTLLSSLPANQQVTMDLLYFGGLTQKEVAEKMGVSEVSVRRYKKQALQQLRNS